MLVLPKIGEIKVRWSRTLPSPSTVTVIRDAAGRFYASFVVESDPVADLERMPDTEVDCGIDLGLTHFAVLSDGRKTDGPKFLRRAEKKLKKAQRALFRKQRGSANRAKARIKVAQFGDPHPNEGLGESLQRVRAEPGFGKGGTTPAP